MAFWGRGWPGDFEGFHQGEVVGEEVFVDAGGEGGAGFGAGGFGFFFGGDGDGLDRV